MLQCNNRLAILEDTIKQTEIKGRKECIKKKQENSSKQSCTRNLIKSINTLAGSLVMYSGSFLKMEKGRTQRNGSKNKETDDKALHLRGDRQTRCQEENDWLILKHVNQSRVILCFEVRELCSLYIYILCAVVSYESFLESVIWYQEFLSSANEVHTIACFKILLSNTQN